MLTALKRTSHGVSFSASYEFGKSLDSNSSFFDFGGNALSYADARNPNLDRGPSDFDLRHRVSVSYIAELPVGPHRALLGNTDGWLGQVVGGWEMSGITSYRTGFPFTEFAGSSTDFSGLNQFADRPNWAPGKTFLPTDMRNPDKAFDASVFVNPPAGSVGYVSRNAFTGPSALNLTSDWPRILRSRRSIRFSSVVISLTSSTTHSSIYPRVLSIPAPSEPLAGLLRHG